MKVHLVAQVGVLVAPGAMWASVALIAALVISAVKAVAVVAMVIVGNFTVALAANEVGFFTFAGVAVYNPRVRRLVSDRGGWFDGR